jgi:acid phosphatase (class A)
LFMTLPSWRHFAFGVSLLAALAARAADQSQVLAPPPVDARLLLPAPPSVGSDEYKAEIAEILAYQASRTNDQVKQFELQANLGPAAFRDILPELNSVDNMPKTQALFTTLIKAAKVPLDDGKSYYKRRRPFQEDSRIHPLGKPDTEFAYPSGHATRGILLAIVMAEIAPEKTDALLERGREIGWNRVIAGLHHPSDIAAGRVLGQAIARSLLRDADFKTQLEEIKVEYEAAKKGHAEPVGAIHAK